MGRELATTHVGNAELHASYRRCRQLNASHGRTYYLATRLLHPRRRPAVHALYGFARYADDIVDDPHDSQDPIEERLETVGAALRRGLATGRSDHPILAAVVDTVTRYEIQPALFTVFLASMRMDLTATSYANRAELQRYVHGSAEVIGLQLLPVFGTVTDREEAAPHAAALGHAFQLTNFLRDVAEDLDRGRIYLPTDELALHGVNRDLLDWCRRTGRLDARVRSALADQIDYTRALYLRARPGISMLHPVSRPCVETAYTLYERILDEIESRDYNVFNGRATVGTPQRLAVGARALTSTVRARLAARATPESVGQTL